MITPGTLLAALKDIVDPSKDGPRDDVTFAYRGSVYVRLSQFQDWLITHGEDGSQAAALATLHHYGFIHDAFTHRRPAREKPTSLSRYRSMNSDLVRYCPSGRDRG